MLAVRTMVEVEADGKAKFELPLAVLPGKHEVLVVLEASAIDEAAPRRSIVDHFPSDTLGPFAEGLSLRREEMYGDDGR